MKTEKTLLMGESDEYLVNVIIEASRIRSQINPMDFEDDWDFKYHSIWKLDENKEPQEVNIGKDYDRFDTEINDYIQENFNELIGE